MIQLNSVYTGIRHEVDPQVVGPETGLAVVTGTSSGGSIATTDELVTALVDHVGVEFDTDRRCGHGDRTRAGLRVHV